MTSDSKPIHMDNNNKVQKPFDGIKLKFKYFLQSLRRETATLKGNRRAMG